MLSTYRANVVRLQKQIADLQQKDSTERTKAADALRKMNAAHTSAAKASSPSSARMYQSAAERESKNMEAAYNRQAGIAKDIGRRSDELMRAQAQVANAEEKDRKEIEAKALKQRQADSKSITKLEKSNFQLRAEYESRIGNLEDQISAAIAQQASGVVPFQVEKAEDGGEPYDFFISHAWEDKEEFVDGFVAKAEAAGLKVWYDKAAIIWGDSIRQKIDEGLRRSYFGVVILSPNFFERKWPQAELDAIMDRDLSGRGRLLPIWHKLTQDEVAEKAPTLANRLALSTASSTSDTIVAELVSMRQMFKDAILPNNDL